jgi:hypothetical protein
MSPRVDFQNWRDQDELVDKKEAFEEVKPIYSIRYWKRHMLFAVVIWLQPLSSSLPLSESSSYLCIAWHKREWVESKNMTAKNRGLLP